MLRNSKAPSKTGRIAALEESLARWRDRLDAATLAGDEEAVARAESRLETLRGWLADARGLRPYREEED